MKLINKTYLNTVYYLIPAMLLASIFTFYIFQYVDYEEVDEHLSYEMERLISYHKIHNDLPENRPSIQIFHDLLITEPYFSDTLILEPADDELMTYRQIHFSIEHEGQSFGIVLQHILLGTDDIWQGTMIIVSGHLIILILVMFFTLTHQNQFLWKPFYKTLHILSQHKVLRAIPKFEKSYIDEFDLLNEKLNELLRKIASDFRNQKEFTENVTHELQTQLSIMRSNTNNLLNTESVTDQQFQLIQKLNKSLLNLQQNQKSLALLSQISNQEYDKNESVNIEPVISQVVEQFEELIRLRNISLKTETISKTIVADKGLILILINNLVKNAVKHNVDNGFININLTHQSFLIQNSGLAFKGESKALIERFEKSKTGNTGIGLAIVKHICDTYSFGLDYSIIDTDTHQVEISFPAT